MLYILVIYFSFSHLLPDPFSLPTFMFNAHGLFLLYQNKDQSPN